MTAEQKRAFIRSFLLRGKLKRGQSVARGSIDAVDRPTRIDSARIYATSVSREPAHVGGSHRSGRS